MSLVARRIHYFLILSLFICILSCKTKQHVFDSNLNKIDASQLDSIIANHNLNYKWYAAKAKLKFHTPDIKESGTAYIRVRKDSIVWMSMKRYSIEGIRMQMDKDSITIIDRIGKYATSMSWMELNEWYGIDLDFEMLQALIVGNVLYDSSRITTIKEDSLQYLVEQYSESYSYQFRIPFFQERISSFRLTDSRLRTLELNFNNCSSEYDYCFFREYRVPLESGQEVYLSLELSDLEIDVEKNIRFEIPSHYTWY